MQFCIVFCAILGAAWGFEDMTVVEWLTRHGFTTMTSLLHATGLDTELSGTGPFTVWAPTNAAFQRRGISMSSVSGDTTELKKMLQYHVLHQYILLPLINGAMPVTTLEGHTMTLHQVTGGAMINNGTRVLGQRDIVCRNGVVQTIDDVLSLPATSATHLNIAQILIRDEDNFRDFALSLMMVGMLQFLEAGDYTLFVPNNAAVGRLAVGIYDPDQPRANLNQGVELMKYYIVPGGRKAAMLHDGQQLYSLHGTTLNVTIDATGGIMINDAHVVQTDIMATNGVIYMIDKTLNAQDVVDQINAGRPTASTSP